MKKAAKVRAEVNAFIDRVFEGCDVILSPTTLLAAQRKDAEVDNEKGFTSDLFSIVCNLTGIPALSVPCGLDGRGPPVAGRDYGKARTGGRHIPRGGIFS